MLHFDAGGGSRVAAIIGSILITRASFLVFALAAVCAAAQTPNPTRPPVAGALEGSPATFLVLPFENESKAPGIEWIGEAFAEILSRRMASPRLHAVSREERLQAFDRFGIPVNLRPSRATLVRIAELLDVDYAVLGEYNFDGQTFSAKAQLLDVAKLKLSPAVQQAGPLPKLIDIQTALAWELQRLLSPDMITSRNQFVSAFPAVRLDAFENYIRGVIAPESDEKIRRFRNALRQSQDFVPAMLALGKELYAKRDYEGAISWLARVPRSEPMAREANFYLGLAAFYSGDYNRAHQAFAWVAGRLPLAEVVNNLGVVAGRRGDRSGIENFQKAIEAEPDDPDYHFNLAVAYHRAGETAAAAEQLRETVRLNPDDSEAKSLLATLTAPARSGGGRTPPANKPGRSPLERIKTNYEEAAFRQQALEMQKTDEARMEKASPEQHAAFHVERGEEWRARGFVGEAEREFREAILLDPANAGAHLGLAQTLEASDDAAGARAEAQAAARLQPSAVAFLVLARLDLKENDTESARRHLEAALALEPTHPGVQALRREMESARGKGQER